MARAFVVGDKVVPSPKVMKQELQKVIGEEVGTVVDVSYLSLQVQYSWGKLIGYRNEFNRHRGSQVIQERSGTALGR